MFFLKVCRNWYDAFYLPQVWSSFFVDDQTLTRAKFNYYSGWQYVLDHFRTQNCLNRIGTFIRGLDFRPLHSFNNLYQFMTLISWYMEQVELRKPKCFLQLKLIQKQNLRAEKMAQTTRYK